MISFQNIAITQDMHDCLIPEDLKADVIYYLKKAHIPYKSIPCKEVEDGPAKEKAINQYRQAGCRSHLHCMGVLQVPIQSDVMFQQICQFFGPQIDSDFAIQKQNIEKKSDEMYEKCYKDWLQEGEIPVKK